MPALSLVPLTAGGVRDIETWFDHPEVRRRLGGREWIHRELDLIGRRPGEVFRGLTTLRSYGWIALDASRTPVAFVGGDVYDRWATYHGEQSGHPVLTDVDPRRSMGLAYVVDPARWRQGIGRATLHAVVGHGDVADVEAFYCGVDAGNDASLRCCRAAGFTLLNPRPDWEGMLYLRRQRHPPAPPDTPAGTG